MEFLIFLKLFTHNLSLFNAIKICFKNSKTIPKCLKSLNFTQSLINLKIKKFQLNYPKKKLYYISITSSTTLISPTYLLITFSTPKSTKLSLSSSTFLLLSFSSNTVSSGSSGCAKLPILKPSLSLNFP